MKGLHRRFHTAGWSKRAALVVLTLFFSLVSPVGSGPDVRGDEVRGIWRLALSGLDQRNIEQFATSQVQPTYPLAAQKYRIEGMVMVQVTVDRNGSVTKAEFVRGHSVFRTVSLDAAKQWRFSAPADASLEGTISFAFKLHD